MSSPMSRAWADNMPLDALNATVKLNAKDVASVKSTDPQRFWATLDRHGTDRSEETLEIVLSSERLINHLTFDLAKFPHDCQVEYYDSKRGWLPFENAEYNGKDDCVYRVMECNPKTFASTWHMPGHQHPQHSFSAHWQSVEFHCKSVRAQRVRLVLRRHSQVGPPRNSHNQVLAYSLAVRKLYIGFKVWSLDCVPKPEPIPSSYTEHKEIATTTDVLGSQVSYSYRVNRAENILVNNPSPTSRTNETLVWRSEPQPNPWCVVNYYSDVRDAFGEAQTLDRFLIDPLYEGANINLYYSNDEPDAAFEAPDEPLPGTVAVINGTTAGPGPLSREDHPYGRVCWVDIDNRPINFRPGHRWWFGCHLNWKFLRGTDALDHPVFDCGEFHISWTRYGLRFATVHGDYFHVDCDDFHPATPFALMVSYESGRAAMRIQVNDQIFYGHRDLSVSLSVQTVTKLRLGGFFSSTSISYDFNLRNLCLKVDERVTEALCLDFFRDPRPYCVKPEFRTDVNLRKSDNAILRYNPEFPTTDYPAGFRGGTPTRYDHMEWSPIARDFIARKGFLQFPPTRAKYWKFEFCGLTPEPYEVYVPIKKTVKTYRTEMWMVPIAPPVVSASISVKLPGLSIQIGVAASFGFHTSIQAGIRIGIGGIGISAGVSIGATAGLRGHTATSVRVVANVQARVALTSVSWAWGFLPCHKPVYVPRFETKCVHEYETIEIEQTTKIAYFAGLKGLKAYKVSYLAADDTAQYVELFQDDANIESDTGWAITAQHELTSGDARFAQAQSRNMQSNRVVRGVQFATTQSAPIQLLWDDDFDGEDPHANWQSVGDGSLAPFTSFEERVGSILRVDRSSRQPSWNELGASVYTTWSSFEEINATWAQVEEAGNSAQSSGGIESKVPATTPPGGRVYAAARVIAPVALQSPLYVQIVDDETGLVLSESGADVAANQITEWWTSYTVGEGGQELAWRWKDFSTSPAYPLYVDSFLRSADAGNLGQLLTKQNWLTEGWPHSIIASEAVVTTGNDFDWVDSVTPWGTMEMTIGAMAGTGQALRPLLYFGPMQVDDQGVVTYSGGRAGLPTTSVFGRAVQVGDALRVDIMPMTQVPSNRRPAGWVDNIAQPYALLFYLNGTWVTTIGHRMGARTRRGFMGRLNQRFRAFAWTPMPYGTLPGPVQTLLPAGGNGQFDTNRLTWTDNEGSIWATTGTLDNATTPGVLTFTSADAKIVTNTGYWYGCLSAGVRKVAAGTIGKHGNVLCLDADNNVFLDAAGNVVRDGVSYGNLIPGGVPDNSLVQVQFLDTKRAAASVRGAIDPAVHPRMLRALVNGAQTGALAFTALQSWNGLRRGLAGDVHDGVAGTPIADFHTSFDSYGWAPDAAVALDPQTPTWDEISQRGTATWDSMMRYRSLNTGKLRARVVQRGESIDLWDMDTLSLFVDPIVWSFSNDGGSNFYSAYDVKNNPNGVLLFPEAVAVAASANPKDALATPGQNLVWRVISYAPNQKVSSLVVRPWYGGLLSGITHRVGTSSGGPNVMPYDHYPPIEEDARFQTWSKPIPQDWFYNFRVLKRSIDEVVPRPKVLMLPEAITSKYKNEIEGS